MDDAGDGRLDKEDLKWGLRDYGVPLSDEEFDMVNRLPKCSSHPYEGELVSRCSTCLTTTRTGTLASRKFLVALRPRLSPSRMALIREAYSRLDKDKSGLVTLADIEMAYDTSYHPGVMNGTMSRTEVKTN